jgi:CRISPR/Cas system CSM-associated protein Csm3 (group 7 of RAMP superfamily)
MARIKVEIAPLKVIASRTLAVGTGFRQGLIQRTVERDADGLLHIPASSLKGRGRRACEQVARQAGLRVCQAPRPERDHMCSAHQPTCLVCRVFGSPGVPGNLRWRDACLSDELRAAFCQQPSAQVFARTQVQLSRALGTAAPDHLFTGETSVEGLTFESAVTGWMDATYIDGDASVGCYELLLLIAGLRLVNTLGGGNSRGVGHISLEMPENFLVDGRDVSWRGILEYLDWLGEFDKEARNV